MNKLVLASLFVAGSMFSLGLPVNAQQKKKAAPAAKPKTQVKNDGGYKKIRGIEYKIITDVPGKTAEVGDMIDFHILIKCDTTVLGDSRAQQAGKPASMPMQEAKNSTDWQLVLPFLSAGDSAVVRVSCDTIIKGIPADNKQPLPPWLKKGNKIMVYLSIVSVKSKAEFEKEQQMKAEQQKVEDDKTLQDYFAKNNLKPTKTASGLYYTITQPGSGPAIQKNQKVTMNYTGKLLNGTTFDSNVDSNFHHMQDFSFPVGAGQVIPGWDEGVMLLKKGAKATFYIPSPLAYGARPMGPLITANSILLFDVEVKDVADK